MSDFFDLSKFSNVFEPEYAEAPHYSPPAPPIPPPDPGAQPNQFTFDRPDPSIIPWYIQPDCVLWAPYTGMLPHSPDAVPSWQYTDLEGGGIAELPPLAFPAIEHPRPESPAPTLADTASPLTSLSPVAETVASPILPSRSRRRRGTSASQAGPSRTRRRRRTHEQVATSIPGGGLLQLQVPSAYESVPNPPQAPFEVNVQQQDEIRCRCTFDEAPSKLRRHWNTACPDNPNKAERFYCNHPRCHSHKGFSRKDNLNRHRDDFDH